jgi:cobalamin biosynthesis Mg chelatase CobN
MRRTVRQAAGVALACAVALVAPVTAHADAFDQVFAQYQHTGKIDGCSFSAKELEQAKSQVPNDIEQYAPDFPDALDAAAAQRAKGACAKRPAATAPTTTQAPATGAAATPPAAGSAAPGATPAPAATAATAQPAAAPQPQPDPKAAVAVADDAIPVAARTAGKSTGAGSAVVLLAVLCVLVVLGLALWGAARWWAFEPPWVVRWRHAVAEAGWRAGNVWSEFVDWVRLGR